MSIPEYAKNAVGIGLASIPLAIVGRLAGHGAGELVKQLGGDEAAVGVAELSGLGLFIAALFALGVFLGKQAPRS